MQQKKKNEKEKEKKRYTLKKPVDWIYNFETKSYISQSTILLSVSSLSGFSMFSYVEMQMQELVRNVLLCIIF